MQGRTHVRSTMCHCSWEKMAVRPHERQMSASAVTAHVDLAAVNVVPQGAIVGPLNDGVNLAHHVAHAQPEQGTAVANGEVGLGERRHCLE